jgi:hypothetical protein
MFAKIPLTWPRIVALLMGVCLLSALGPARFEDGDGDDDADAVWKGRPLPRPDSPGEAMAFRLRQWRDENGVYRATALVDAKAHVEAMRQQPLSSLASPAAGITNAGWTWLGPGNIGGRVRSLVIDPTNVSTMLAGSVGGGIFKTTDGGASWAPVDDFMANLAVSAMVMQPGTPTTIYAGTGEGFFNGDGLQGAGVFKSTDGGTTWNQLASTNDPSWFYVNRLAISPDGLAVVAATRSGIFRSTDGGSSWTQVLASFDGLGILDIDFHPADSSKAVASGYSGNAYYSIDGGLSWTAATGLVAGSFRRVEIAYAPSNPAIVYASEDVNGGTIFKSLDGGATYMAVSNPPQHYLSGQGWYDNALWVDPTNENRLVVGGVNLWKSTNGGGSISQISNWASAPQSAHADNHAIVAQPGFNGSTNTTVFFTNDGGVYKTTDVYTVGGGAYPYETGWIALNNNLGITQFYGAGGNAAGGVILGGTQDNGTLKYTPATGTTWSTEFGGDGGFSAVSQTNANHLYGEYVYLMLHRSLDGGTTTDWINGLVWDGSNWVCKPAPYSIADSCNNGQANFIAPFVLDPNDSNTLLGGGSSLWRTNDASTPNTATTGPAWTNIKPPVSAFNVISAIGIAPTDSNQIWVGHNGGELYKTTNGMSAAPTWTRMGAGTLPARYLTRARVDPTDANVVYAAFGGFSTPNLWKSIDGGTTWAAASGTGLTALPDAPVRDIAVSPGASSWLYAATEVGVFTSLDGGATWTVPQDGPANVSVDELFWMGSSLVAVTHGRGLFKTDPAGLTVGTLTGVVLDATTAAGVANALITISPGGATTTTNATGLYSITVPPGTYAVTVSATNYGTASQSGAVVQNGGTTTVNFSIGAPGTLTGHVRDATTTAPIANAQISISPGGIWIATDAQGLYTKLVPAGTYDIAVSANGYTSTSASGLTATFGGTTTHDFTLAPILTAIYDPVLKAPRCSQVKSVCDSGPALIGRASLGPEPNQPNTIYNSCPDGTIGAFHSDESNDAIKVSTVDGTPLAAGKTVRIDATVFAWSSGTSDHLDLFYADDATNPVWNYITTATPSAGGVQTLSATYNLPNGNLQAVRARFRYSGSVGSCTLGNSYDDQDDLIFAVSGPSAAVLQAQGPNFGTHSIGQIEIPLTATRGDGTYVWSVVGGALPPGISVRTDKPQFFPTNASAGLIGVATAPGTYNFTLRVTSGGTTADQACTLTVTGLTVKDGNHFNYLPSASVGTPYSYTLTALNPAGAVTWSATGTPPGIALSPGGVLSGTPTASGSYYIAFTVTDGVDTASRGLSLRVNALNITEGVLPNAIRGVPYSYTLTATGGTPPYTFTGNAPYPFTLSPSGTISGTAMPFSSTGPAGAYVIVTDSVNAQTAKYISVDVIGPPPKFAWLTPAWYGHFDDCTVGMTCSRGIAVRSGGIAPFTWTAIGLPPGVSLRAATGDTNTLVSAGPGYGYGVYAGDAEIWGVPTATGTFDVTVMVTGADNITATHNFPMHVSGLGQPNRLSSPTLGVPYSQTARVIGGSLPYAAAHFAEELPAGLTLDPTTSLVSGTPLENGYFSPVFAFTDSNNDTYHVTEYLPLNGAGVGSNIAIYPGGDLGMFTVGSNFATQMNACCGTLTWLVAGGTLPPGLSLSSSGFLNGTFTADGSYTFLIRATDAADTAHYGQRQLTLHVVSGSLLTITTYFQLPSGAVGAPYLQTFAATGGTGALTWSVKPFNYLPPGITLASNGILSGTPAGSGQFQFAVNVSDTGGHTATRSFNVSINPPANPPQIEVTSPVEPIYDLGSALLAQYTCVNAVTCVGDVPNGGAINTSVPGDHTFTVTATDAGGNTTVATVRYAISLGNCVPPLLGLAAWLPGDGTAEDLITHTSATWTGTPAYAAGRAGQGFAVSPGNDVSLPLQQAGAFALEAWVSTPSSMQPEGTGIVSTGGAGQLATSFQIELDGLGNYRLTAGDAELSMLIGPARNILDHVAVTFDMTTLMITTYLNGQMVDQQTWLGAPGLGFDTLELGLDRGGTRSFTGVIDEVEVFARALTDAEVLQTFLAGSAGFCRNHAPTAVIAVMPSNPAEATGPAGATVTLNGTGSSDPDNDTLTYSWAEETTPLGTGSPLTVPFSLGSHSVTLTVDDGHGKSNSTTITVVVHDTTPPALLIPTSVVAEATSPSGAPVSYSASAFDIVSGAVPINCVLPSGSQFPIGVTLVQCTAVDAAGNIASGPSGTFPVLVQDTTPPVAQITSPSTDVLLSSPSAVIVVQATDVVGVAGVIVNGVAATMTSGTAQAGTWRATVPITLPVPPGGALLFNAVASDAAGNPGAGSLVVDNDGIPSALDRDRASGAAQANVYSSDFNNNVTAGTLTRNGWTAVLSNMGTAGTVRAQISGAGSIAKIRACTGATKEVRLDAIGETADLTCTTSTGTITVRAMSARPWIEVWKQQSNSTWLVAQLPTGATYSTGSPATAGENNTQPIDVRVVHLDEAGATTSVGGFRLAPGESVDVSVTPGGAGGDEQVHFNVLRGRVTVTVSGRTRTLSNGDRATLPIDLAPPKIVCGSTDDQWHADHVRIACAADDAATGLRSAVGAIPTGTIGGGTRWPPFRRCSASGPDALPSLTVNMKFVEPRHDVEAFLAST